MTCPVLYAFPLPKLPGAGLTGFLLILCCLFTNTAFAQQERVLQRVSLKQPGNRAYYSPYSYLLPGLVTRGIETGKIKPYQINYEANTITSLSRDEYRKSLKIEEDMIFSGERNLGDDILLWPGDLNQVLIDVTREKGTLKKINYLHFQSFDPLTYLYKTHFAVSFDEVAAYLDAVEALSVRNESPLVWKNQILHTHGDYPAELLAQVIPGPMEDVRNIHLITGTDGQYEQLALYSWENKILKTLPFKDLAATKGHSDIRWMSEALLAGMYQADEQEPEVKLTTTLPEAKNTAPPRRPATAFSIIQTDKIYLDLPENQKFNLAGKAFFSAVNQAVKTGRLSPFTSDSLNKRMSFAEWQQRFEVYMPQLSAEEKASLPSLADSLAGLVLRTHGENDITLMHLAWKKYFNTDGKITHEKPYALGFCLGSDKTEIGVEMPVGYFAFDEVMKVLKKGRTARQLSDLAHQDYFGYWLHSSRIIAEQTLPKNKFRKR